MWRFPCVRGAGRGAALSLARPCRDGFGNHLVSVLSRPAAGAARGKTESHAMCELFAMSASAPVRVRYDLDSFAREGGERHRNRDGWGIVFAEGRDAHWFREAAPAASSPLDRFVREHETPHRTVMAHVRRASAGPPALVNTHPFRRIHDGEVHHFAHNGTLHGLENDPGARALIRHRVGDTDSELAFLLFLDRLRRHGPARSDIDARFALFRRFARDMAALGPANFLWFDGATLFVHADRRVHETQAGPTPPQPPGLHILRPGPGGLGQSHDCTGARLKDLPEHVTLFASVPLSAADWEPLAQGCALAVADGRILRQAATGESGTE